MVYGSICIGSRRRCSINEVQHRTARAELRITGPAGVTEKLATAASVQVLIYSVTFISLIHQRTAYRLTYIRMGTIFIKDEVNKLS